MRRELKGGQDDDLGDQRHGHVNLMRRELKGAVAGVAGGATYANLMRRELKGTSLSCRRRSLMTEESHEERIESGPDVRRGRRRRLGRIS